MCLFLCFWSRQSRMTANLCSPTSGRSGAGNDQRRSETEFFAFLVLLDRRRTNQRRYGNGQSWTGEPMNVKTHTLVRSPQVDWQVLFQPCLPYAYLTHLGLAIACLCSQVPLERGSMCLQPAECACCPAGTVGVQTHYWYQSHEFLKTPTLITSPKVQEPRSMIVMSWTAQGNPIAQTNGPR